MQLTTFLSAATAMIATVSATTVRTAVTLNSECNLDKPHARIINRCNYPVHLWSVLKGTGCPSDGMVTLQQGEIYSENYDNATAGATGVSIKVSKTEQCSGNDIVQLEYYLDYDPVYGGNYLDVSYVDCLGGDCPTKTEGYYLRAGSQSGEQTASASNTWCPILSCHDAASCAKCSYILPDDTQTKTCKRDANMDFYMCGGDAPDGSDSTVSEPASSAAPASSTKKVESSKKAESSAASPTSVQDAYTENLKVAAAAVTNAPEINQKTKTQVQVVYVTAYEYVNAKRHAHGHARRHQPFRA